MYLSFDPALDSADQIMFIFINFLLLDVNNLTD